MKSFSRYAWGVLVFNLPVIVWGAFVRASGSGAGCGNHWPLCNGEVIPHSPEAAKLIEFTHRAMTGLDTPLILLLGIWAWRAFPKRHPARTAATLSIVFLVIEALIGAGLVLLEKVARNASAYWQSAHLLNTLTLLSCLTLTAWFGAGHPATRPRGRAAWMTAMSLALVALLGVSGAIAALGDTLFPAKSLASGLAQDLDPAADAFLHLRALHPLFAAITAAWLFYFSWSIAKRLPHARPLALTVIACVALQLTAGAINLLLLAPVGMQLLHLALADVLWIALVILCAAAPEWPDHAPAPRPVSLSQESIRG